MDSKLFQFNVLYSFVEDLYVNTIDTIRNGKHVKIIKYNFMPYFEKEISRFENFNCSIVKNSYVFNDQCALSRSNTAFMRINGTCKLCLCETPKPVKYILTIDSVPINKFGNVVVNLKIKGNHLHRNGEFIFVEQNVSNDYVCRDQVEKTVATCKKRYDGDELQILGEESFDDLMVSFNGEQCRYVGDEKSCIH